MNQPKTRKKCTCLRCGWEWFPRNQEKEPTTCANQECRSPYWNKERVYKLEGKPKPTSKRVSIERENVELKDEEVTDTK